MSGLEVHAQTLDDLVTQSNKLVAAFDTSMKVIGGMEEATFMGRIVPVGISEVAKISDRDAVAYNDATTSYKSYSPDAQEWLNATADSKILDLNNSIEEFVNAASPLVEATRVANMAQQAQLSGDLAEQQALEDYVKTNDVVVDNNELAAFNTSVSVVEESAAVAGAYIAAANDPKIVEAANSMASQFKATYSEVTEEMFNRDTNHIEIQFASYNRVIALNMSAYVISAEEVLNIGASSYIYLNSPTQDDCYFNNASCGY